MNLQRWRWALVVASLVIPLVSVEGRAEATVPGFNGHIAFQTNFSNTGSYDSYDIWVVAPDGTQLRALTSSVEDERDPAWSPDGTRIAFAGGNQIQVINADGSGRTMLAKAGLRTRNPSWSSDGSVIIFDFFDGDKNRLGVVDVAKGSQSQQVFQPAPGECPFKNKADQNGTYKILRCEARHYAGPSFSPGGSLIALVVSYVGIVQKCTYAYGDLAPSTQCTEESFTRGSLAVMNRNGTGLTHLFEVDDNTAPSWSPDNKEIAFKCGKVTISRTDLNRNYKVMAELGANPAWSPDGALAAYDFSNAIGIMDAATGQRGDDKSVAKGTNPDWQPTLAAIPCLLTTVVSSGGLAVPGSDRAPRAAQPPVLNFRTVASAATPLSPAIASVYAIVAPISHHAVPAMTAPC